MANAIEEALNRANADQRAHAMQTIQEARRVIQNAELEAANLPSGDAAATIARQEQIIEEAKRSIPTETMVHVDEIGPPMNTPAANDNFKSDVVELSPDTKDKIEAIQQGEGNNYLNQNAVDRAMNREPQAYEEPEQQRAMER